MKAVAFLAGALAAAWMPGPVLAQAAFSNAVSLGPAAFGALKEPSGLAASRQNEGVIWTHNDSGDMARVFALDTQGRLLGIYKLPAVNIDYEDIAVGPGPVPNVLYVYVGDIGDNFSRRSSVTIYLFPEPAVYLRQVSSPPTLTINGLRTVTLTYPDGPRNAESLLVDPWTGDVFIASKEETVSRLYTATKAQMDAGGPIVLSFVRQIDFDLATGGDISPTGHEVILRQKNYARLWTRELGQSVGQALGGVAVAIPVVGEPTEVNGEAIGFDSVGRGYFTLGDYPEKQPLYYFGRISGYAVPPPRVLVSAGATWRYLDTGTNLGIAWRAGGYNDAAWRAGDGQFGYGDGAERTTVSFGPKSNSKFITTYFRKSFVVTNTTNIARLDFRLLFDDGAAAYLNGTRIALANLDPGATATNLATTTQEAFEDTWFTFPVDPALLIVGTNVLAVDVHQAAVNSPDLSFDAQLIAYDAPPPPRILTGSNQPGGTFLLTIAGSLDTVTVEASTNFTSWSALGTAPLTNGSGAFLDAPGSTIPCRFYRLRQ